MPDYGHELRFGVFPSPDASAVERTLELAHLAEVGGLDLVSVQDHPYQRRHLDAWTLLSWIAAGTSAITVAPNVANLPLRLPAVLASSVATLDRLSHGRVELGLGAGAFWDAIVAAGGPRRTPREAVDALVEAIGVVRQTWARGPEPAHDVPIWLGAYGPRMLRVTGRLADAWIPSMGYADPPVLGEMNATIDEAAEQAGRGPAAVRRMYNVFGRFGSGSDFLQGSVQDWVEQLAGLALDEGFSTFVLGTDDPDQLRGFAAEVAPGVRELVEAERALRAEDPPADPAAAARPAAQPTTQPTTQPAAQPVAPEHRSDPQQVPTSTAWDEAARPTYPTPAGVRYTAVEEAWPQHLVDVHDALRRELAQVRDVVDQVRRGLLQVGQARSIINTMTMRQNSWTLGAYCESYCRIVTGHHTLEDRSMFPHLRASDPAATPVIDRLEEEHHVIAEVLERVDRALVGLVAAEPSGATDALEALSSEVDLLTDTLLSHLAYEERELRHPLAVHGMG